MTVYVQSSQNTAYGKVRHVMVDKEVCGLRRREACNCLGNWSGSYHTVALAKNVYFAKLCNVGYTPMGKRGCTPTLLSTWQKEAS